MDRIIRPLLAALLLTVLGAAYACGGDGDDGGVDTSPTATRNPEDTGPDYATPKPPQLGPSPLNPAPPVGEPTIDTSDWQEFSHSSGLATVKFPAEWTAAFDNLFSWDQGGEPPLAAVSLEAGDVRIIIAVTPLGNYENRPSVAEDLTIPAGSGWHSDYGYDPLVSGNIVRIHEVGIPFGDQAVFLTGYMSEIEQEEIFAAIVWSLQVTNA